MARYKLPVVDSAIDFSAWILESQCLTCGLNFRTSAASNLGRRLDPASCNLARHYNGSL